jgi:hypothetical protein
MPRREKTMSKDATPAFPSYDGHNPTHVGMTLRDYFAAQAVTAMCGPIWPSDSDAAELARRSYFLADAMLSERSKGES